MRRLILTLGSTGVLTVASPVIAGPDFHMIDQARTAHQARAQMQQNCETKRLVLPVDHGPRAQTTPYLNKLRTERFHAEMTACRAAPKPLSKGSHRKDIGA